MSFITKRDRVFNEYDLFDLPARNEGKLKAYASCTDARAWSHFCSDKSEHLVEIIKRNNEICRPKYVPTDAIVNTLMAAKNAEISRLKHKIEEFEQMLAAYYQLELTPEQKNDIANAQAAIKAANKELDEMCLDLDLSGYTEGIDSEAFETGKSRGDEASINTAHEIPRTKIVEWEFEQEPMPAVETKANQTGAVEPCDASTSVQDSRIDELKDVIISKDAKLSAMQNTIAVMENDICEPYCIYAHIYTALEKIFGTLCQNAKYKEYLDLLTAGKDTRGIDVKGKILYKMKVLEKFSMALIAPCSQDYTNQSKHECSCYRAQVETTFALTSPSTRLPNLDNKRAYLVADIMENTEMREILSKESISTKTDDNRLDESYGLDSYSIETENLNRLKNLQANYEDLLNCYENVKYEKSCLESKCKRYEELEKDFERLRNHSQEYRMLWNEKEHYRKRSEDLDDLKEKFLVLSEETSNIETQLKAELEINHIKSKAVDELRSENISLEKKLNDMSISFEREKNMCTCKLKEYECKMMCQEQQIKSLTAQVDELLEQDRIPSNYDSTKMLELNDEIVALKQQIQNLQNALFCDEEEKHQLEVEFAKKLELINDLKLEIEEWKSNYEKAVQSQNYLEKYTKKYQEEMQILKDENKNLSKELEKKSNDVDQLISTINSKSQEIMSLVDELGRKKIENRDLYHQLQDVTENFDKNLSSLENEKKNALFSLKLARKDSKKLLENYEDPHSYSYHKDDTKSEHDIEDNERCLMNIVDRDNENSMLLQEIHKLQAENISNITKLQDENTMNKKSLELLKTESAILKHKLLNYESLSQQFRNLKESHDRLLADKIKLENELCHKSSEMENELLLKRKESETLMDHLQQSRNLQDKLNSNYEEMLNDRYSLLEDLSNKDAQLQIMSEKISELSAENERLRQESQRMFNLEQELRDLSNAYIDLKNKFDCKAKEVDNLYNSLENKVKENRELSNQIETLHNREISGKKSVTMLQSEKSNIEANLNILKEQSAELIDKIKYYENIENELGELNHKYDRVKLENQKLEKDIEIQKSNINKLQNENTEINIYSQNLLTLNEELEKNLINARNQIVANSREPQEYVYLQKEVENMKLEKTKNHERIKSLLDKLEEWEYVISSLKEDLIAREDKISLLENHINELQDEVRRLHSTLADLTESTEQIKDYSLQNIEQSLKRMEAHHSKATHDMRSELARLQNDNELLENQLSATRLKSEESLQDVNKYVSQITSLQNERIAIVTDIKQLEVRSIGDSVLSPNNSTIEDIQLSLRKITNYLESRQSKTTSLEKTLLKVQSSFQLVLEKADEEKKNVDEEKQKLLDEKDAALTELHNSERELQELKIKYEKQAAIDRRVIDDLQAEILNQNLIIEKINKSKADYISKLEAEIQSLQKMYETSISKVRELQDKMNTVSLENNKNLTIIEDTDKILREKCKEIDHLQSIIQMLKQKSIQSVSTQVETFKKVFAQVSTQTERQNEQQVTEQVTLQKVKNDTNDKNVKCSENSKDIMTEILPKNEQYPLNDVQILRANIDLPSLDCTKSAYINYKMKQLNFGPMETNSIPSFSKLQDSNIEKSYSNEDETMSGSGIQETFFNHNKHEKSNTIDVYSVQCTNSSQKLNKLSTKKQPKNSNMVKKHSSISLSDIKKYANNIENNLKGPLAVKKHKSDKDLFLIYNDNDHPVENKTKLLEIYNRDQLQKSDLNNGSKIVTTENINKKRQKDKNIKDVITAADKPKLQIELPRIATDSSSINNTSDGDNKSIDSYTYAIYSVPKRTTYSDMDINNKQESSNVPLYGSPDPFDKLSHEEKVHDVFLQNTGTESSKIELNAESSNKINASLLRVGSDLPSIQDGLNITANSQLPKSDSRHKLSRVGANVLLVEYSDGRSASGTVSSHQYNDSQETLKSVNFGLQYILDTMRHENDPHNVTAHKNLKSLKRITNTGTETQKIYNDPNSSDTLGTFKKVPARDENIIFDEDHDIKAKNNQKSFNEFGVLVKMDSVEGYENKIHNLTKTLENIEKDYKKKIDAVKVQYDSNIKNIINEHNQGVRSIQSLHEETMHDVIKLHENEVENLRTMSIEALRKVEKLEKENHALKTKIFDNKPVELDEEPVKISTPERKRRGRSHTDTKNLTKTSVEAFNVKPKIKSHGPCTCSVDINISDTIRNIFQQVDAEQRKVAENSYLKYIANKISNNNIEALDAQELSFLHLKVCRTWKTKLSKEEALQKRIDSLESELVNKQRQAQLHMAELDRKVAEERRRLQEVREAVCRTPGASRDASPEPLLAQPALEKNTCNCNRMGSLTIGGRRSAGDLGPGLSGVVKMKRTKVESNRAVLAKLDTDERRDRKFYEDPPVRLKRSHDRSTLRKK